MLDFGPFFNQQTMHFLKDKAKKLRETVTEKEIEKWLGTWDYSGQVVYQTIETSMEEQIGQELEKEKKKSNGNTFFMFENNGPKIDKDGIIDAEYSEVADDDEVVEQVAKPLSKKEQFVKPQNKDYF